MLERCARCRVCVRACPTGAIREERFLISAERCYAFFSERRKPFPSWIRPPKSVFLIGCLICQQVCPETKGRLETRPSGNEFSAEETEAVLEAGRLPAAGERGGDVEAEGKRSVSLASARAKLEMLGVMEEIEIIDHNLDDILRARKNGLPLI